MLEFIVSWLLLLIVLPLCMLFVVPFMLFEAYVFRDLFNWFIVPYFKLPELLFSYSLGFIIVKQLVLRGLDKKYEKSKWKENLIDLLNFFLRLSFIWLQAYLIHKYLM